MKKKGEELRSLFDFDPQHFRAQRAFFDRLGQKHGLAPGEYFDLTRRSTHTQRGRRRADAEAWVLENAAKRKISVFELLRNLATMRSMMDASDTKRK